MNDKIVEMSIPIDVPDAHGFVLTRESFTQGATLCDDDAEVIRMISEHVEDTAPIGKITQMTAHVDSTTIPNMGVIRQHIEFGHPVPDGDNVLMQFSDDHRPFKPLHDSTDIGVDRANFDRDEYKTFVEQAKAIYPDAELMSVARHSVEPEAVLWIGKAIAIAIALGAARNVPIIGPILKDVEEAVVESIDAKRRVKSLIAAFTSAIRQKKSKVNMSIPIGKCTAVFIADSEDAAQALPEAGQALLDNADLLVDATEVLFIYKDANWQFQYKIKVSGDVLMTRDCFDRTMAKLTDSGSIIYPEQLGHIETRFIIGDYPTGEYSCETQLEHRSPAGNLIRVRAATAELTPTGTMLTFRNGEKAFFADENAEQAREMAKRAWQRAQKLRDSTPSKP